MPEYVIEYTGNQYSWRLDSLGKCIIHPKKTSTTVKRRKRKKHWPTMKQCPLNRSNTHKKKPPPPQFNSGFLCPLIAFPRSSVTVQACCCCNYYMLCSVPIQSDQSSLILSSWCSIYNVLQAIVKVVWVLCIRCSVSGVTLCYTKPLLWVVLPCVTQCFVIELLYVYKACTCMKYIVYTRKQP